MVAVPGKIFIGGMPYSMNEKELKENFERFGTVTDTFIVRDREEMDGSKKSKGYGFITFEDQSSADEAIKAMHQSTLEGRTITVNHATKPTGGRGGMVGGRGGGFFRGGGMSGGRGGGMAGGMSGGRGGGMSGGRGGGMSGGRGGGMGGGRGGGMAGGRGLLASGRGSGMAGGRGVGMAGGRGGYGIDNGNGFGGHQLSYGSFDSGEGFDRGYNDYNSRQSSAAVNPDYTQPQYGQYGTQQAGYNQGGGQNDFAPSQGITKGAYQASGYSPVGAQSSYTSSQGPAVGYQQSGQGYSNPPPMQQNYRQDTGYNSVQNVSTSYNQTGVYASGPPSNYDSSYSQPGQSYDSNSSVGPNYSSGYSQIDPSYGGAMGGVSYGGYNSTQ